MITRSSFVIIILGILLVSSAAGLAASAPSTPDSTTSDLVYYPGPVKLGLLTILGSPGLRGSSLDGMNGTFGFFNMQVEYQRKRRYGLKLSVLGEFGDVTRTTSDDKYERFFASGGGVHVSAPIVIWQFSNRGDNSSQLRLEPLVGFHQDQYSLRNREVPDNEKSFTTRQLAVGSLLSYRSSWGFTKSAGLTLSGFGGCSFFGGVLKFHDDAHYRGATTWILGFNVFEVDGLQRDDSVPPRER